MAPGYDLDVNDSSPDDFQSQEFDDTEPESRVMAELEETYQASSIRVGQEVEAFAGAVDKYVTNHGSPAERRANIFKLVGFLHDYSRQRLEVARQRDSLERAARRRRGLGEMDIDDADDDSDSSSAPNELRKLEQETQTWDLLRRLLPLRYREMAPKRQDDVASQSRGQYWNDFLQSDSLARERKAVLEWLQSSASDGPPIAEVVKELQQSSERGDIIAHGWLHTRAKLKLAKSMNTWEGVIDPKAPELGKAHLTSTTLITQLDPDAMTRQDRKLEPQDEYFERAIWLGCFEMLRRGYSMAEIRDWCSERTEVWRAAAVSGLALSRTDEEVLNPDPSSAILWRRMCFAVARQGGIDDYERAVFGMLSGDILSVEKVCKTWDDFIFTHYNALLRTQYDAYLIKRGGNKASSTSQLFPAFNAVQMHGDPVTVGKRLVASLEADERTKAEACTRTKALQGAIISNDLDRHLYNQGLVFAQYANKIKPSKLLPTFGQPAPDSSPKYFKLTDHDGLRILAHVFIVITALDRLSGASDEGDTLSPLFPRRRVQEHVIAGYVSYLRLANLEEMIPLYCSMLAGARRYHCLSRNLIYTVDRDARAAQINIMYNLGLNIAEFATIQPQIYLDDVKDKDAKCITKGEFSVVQGQSSLKYGRIVKPDFFGDDPELIEPEDEKIIRAMEWLTFVDGLFIETCRYAIRAYKYFLKKMHLRAARSLFNRLPFSEVVKQKTEVPIRDDPTPLWFEDFQAAEFSEEFLEENEMSKVELVATVRILWELECLVKSLDSMETLSSFAEIARESNNISRDLWTQVAEEVKATKAYMRPLLHDWLGSSFKADADFTDLREAYIPETVLIYISSLHFVGTTVSRDNLLECMELAATIADKDSDVAKLFVGQGRMKELVEAFASASKALAIVSGERKGPPTSSKKLREMGWSRELWSIKP